MNINWKIRFKNPIFYVQLILSVFTPILAYMGLSLEDLTSWVKVGGVLMSAVQNPYVLGLVAVNVYNSVIDPTTTGISDSAAANEYTSPNNVKGLGI